jgi:hypothetical protein
VRQQAPQFSPLYGYNMLSAEVLEPYNSNFEAFGCRLHSANLVVFIHVGVWHLGVNVLSSLVSDH